MRLFFLILLTTSSCFFSFQPAVSANEPDRAQPKRGVTVSPPFSEQLPDHISRLPSFGTITWKTRRLPWVKEGPYAGISGASMSVHDGKIYVAGGFIPGGDDSGDLSSSRTSRWTWLYNPETDSWTQLPNAPFRREYTRSTVSGNSLYLIGGGKISKGKQPPYQPYGNCAQLDLSTETPTWHLHSKLNVPRTHTSVGSIDNFLVVAGGNEYQSSENGYSYKTIRNTMEVFDLTKPAEGWQVRSPIPSPGRGWSGSVTYDKYLYLFGGVTWNKDNSTTRIQETLRYDPATDEWKQLTAPPVAISGWEAAVYHSRYALIAGGVLQPDNNSQQGIIWSDLIWAYDLQSDKWLSVKGALPPGAVFNDPGVCIIDDTIYVLGAEGPAGNHYNYFLIGKINPK